MQDRKVWINFRVWNLLGCIKFYAISYSISSVSNVYFRVVGSVHHCLETMTDRIWAQESFKQWCVKFWNKKIIKIITLNNYFNGVQFWQYKLFEHIFDYVFWIAWIPLRMEFERYCWKSGFNNGIYYSLIFNHIILHYIINLKKN